MANRTPTSDLDQTQPLAARARVEALAADADPGEDDDTDDLPEPIPVWTMPQPGSYERLGADTKHRHDSEREDFHYEGHLPHYHDPDSGILVFFDPTPSVPAASGDGALREESALADAQADPTPAGTPDVIGASAMTNDREGESSPVGSGAAGAGRPRDELGRFIASSSLPPRVELRRIHPPTLPVSVALEHALIDADVDLWKAAMHLRLERARTILATIRFEAEADRLEDVLAVKAGMLVRLGSDGGGS